MYRAMENTEQLELLSKSYRPKSCISSSAEGLLNATFICILQKLYAVSSRLIDDFASTLTIS